MNSTWIISPNWLAWGLLFLAVAALCAIALRMWLTPRHSATQSPVVTTSTSEDKSTRNHIWVIYVWFTIGIVAVFLSLFSIDRGHFSLNRDSATDNVLSILVAFLVAWQIIQTMISRREIERANEASQRITELETMLNVRSAVLTQRNMEITHLIDAHAHLRNAQNSEYFSDAYSHFAHALNHFILSNVLYDYNPFQESIRGLADSLIYLENDGEDDDKRNFIEMFDDYERLYHNIVASIHQRQQDIERLHSDIIGLREDRIALRDKLSEPQPPTPEH